MIRADSRAARTRRQQQHRVVGRRIAVHRDAIEAHLDRLAQIAVEHGRSRLRVRQHVDQHGGVRHQLRMNHPRALARRRDPDFLPVNLHAREGCLLHRVGGDDRLRDFLEVIRLRTHARREFRQRRDQLFRGQRNADDSCRRRKHLPRTAAEHLRDRLAGGARGIDARLPRRAVGVACVDGHHAHLAAGGAQMLHVDQHRRGLHAIAGERGRGAGRRVGNDQRKVRASAGLQSCFRRAKTEALRNQKLRDIAHRSRNSRRPGFIAGLDGFKPLI